VFLNLGSTSKLRLVEPLDRVDTERLLSKTLNWAKLKRPQVPLSLHIITRTSNHQVLHLEYLDIMKGPAFLAVAALAPAISAQAALYQQCQCDLLGSNGLEAHFVYRWWNRLFWKHNLCIWRILQQD
jgi:hypothetical protein